MISGSHSIMYGGQEFNRHKVMRGLEQFDGRTVAERPPLKFGFKGTIVRKGQPTPIRVVPR